MSWSVLTCQAGFEIVGALCVKCGASDRDICAEITGETFPQGLEIVRLRKAVKDLLDTRGTPHRDEYLNDYSFKQAMAAHAQATAAVKAIP